MARALKRLPTVAVALLACLVAGLAQAATTATRSSSFVYDPISGLLVQEVVEPGTPTLSSRTDYGYDAFGNIIQKTVSGFDIPTRSATSQFDAQGRFAVAASNATGQSESWQYDPRFGLPTSHTGPNGLTTSWSYDGFGRKTLERRPDGTQTTFQYVFCAAAGGPQTCPNFAITAVIATPLAADGTSAGPIATAYYDQLGRVVGEDTQGFDGSQIRVTTQYDHFGRVVQKSRPYIVGTTPRWTTFQVDALNRITKETHPDGSITQYVYQGLRTSVTNTLNQTRTVVKNDQGLVASATDALNQVTTYAYDPFGNLTSTTDPVGNVATYTYDARGRRITSSDPDLGAWQYAYNTLDQLTSQTDAKGQTTYFQYDLLGRLTQRVEPDMTCAWVYDTAPGKGVGKLASTAISTGPSAGYQRSYTYDGLGRPSQVAVTVDGATYNVASTYDAASRLATATSPSGLSVRYAYNARGYVTQLTNASSGTVYWTALSRDAELHLTSQQAGNGVVTNQSFDPNTGFLTGIYAGTLPTPVENFSFTYDALGNLTGRGDLNMGLRETFTYDALNRLTGVAASSPTGPLAGPWSDLTYDALGNITKRSELGTYAYPLPGSPRPHAVTGVTGPTINSTFTYDANGNQTSGLGRTIAYTSFNKPSSITQGTVSLSFTHDPEHQRLKKLDRSGTALVTTTYLNVGPILAEQVTSTGSTSVTWNDYLTVNGEMVALRTTNSASTTNTTLYFHKDHLGSIAVVTDSSGAVVQRLSYSAWGQQRNPGNWTVDPTGALAQEDPTTRGFTGQEQLADVGLVHLNGRVYDPVLGRFTSADPVTRDPYNAQSWNRYSYVEDNPLTFADPSGYCFMGCFWKPVFHGVGQVVKAINSVPVLGQAISLAIAIEACGPAVSVCSAAIMASSDAFQAGVTSGKLGVALKVGAISAASAAAFYEVGSATGMLMGGDPALGHQPFTFALAEAHPAALAFNALGHAAVGCAAAAALGNGCGPAALAGAAGSLSEPLVANMNFGAALVTQATIGGIVSVAGGGKFANGAVTAAYGYVLSGVLAGAAEGAAGDQVASNPYDPYGHGFAPCELAAIGVTPCGGLGGGGIGATGRVGEEALRSLGGESQVYFQTSLGPRVVDQLIDGIAHESKVGYQTLTTDLSRQIAKDAELMQSGQIQGATWHFFRSPLTGNVGPSGPLARALQQNGINVILH